MKLMFWFSLITVGVLGCLNLCNAESKIKKIESGLLILTVATEETDGFLRFRRSAKEFGVWDSVEVLGMGSEWKGGDVRLTAGGGQKVGMIKKALEPHKDDSKLVVMFTDSYDVIINAPIKDILERFEKEYEDARVLFSAEGFCWPDKGLAVKYPIVKSGKRYLCSGLFMGYAPEIYAIVSEKEIADSDDDQLYYTQIFLDKALREKHKIQLDNTGKIFQNLNGATEDVEVKFSPHDGIAEIHNVAYNTRPMIIHGNGGSKIKLNELGNYIGKAWTKENGCLACMDDLNRLEGIKSAALPTVCLALFVEKPTPFVEEFLVRVANQDYPKEKMFLYVHNHETYHKQHVQEFIDKFKDDFKGGKFRFAVDHIEERVARAEAVEYCLSTKADYYFVVDSEAQLTNPEVLRVMIEQNRTIIGPMLTRPGKMWSNFWGSISEEGFYDRSTDYMDIVQYNRRGVWNVPFMTQSYLVHAKLLQKMKNPYDYNIQLDPDMSFAQYCRDNDWELRYLHANYTKVLKADEMPDEVCPDVYNFPLFSPRMCWELIAEMENFGQWSGGSTKDDRLAGGYEAVPTRDIHMNQVGFERHFLDILENYVRPMQEKVFIGYYHTPVNALMNFVVRYRPDEQPNLRPHHDSSTYTIDVALNRHNVDYEGGGVRFLRYNCSLIGHEQGWSIIMPGRLTHFHEGLTTTKGTRYILISFINP